MAKRRVDPGRVADTNPAVDVPIGTVVAPTAAAAVTVVPYVVLIHYEFAQLLWGGY